MRARRIRVQLSASHPPEDVETCVRAFAAARAALAALAQRLPGKS